eukprot:6335480-Pyramimonas_sp.AAC.1
MSDSLEELPGQIRDAWGAIRTLGGVNALAASFRGWQSDEALDGLRGTLPATPQSFAGARQWPRRSFTRCVAQRL